MRNVGILHASCGSQIFNKMYAKPTCYFYHGTLCSFKRFGAYLFVNDAPYNC